MIQNAIARFAPQSTTIKGWSITVTAALLGFGATTTTPVVAVVAGYATLAFAALDAYYLSLERAYRKLYDSAVADHAEPWSLSVTRPSARNSLRPSQLRNRRHVWHVPCRRGNDWRLPRVVLREDRASNDPTALHRTTLSVIAGPSLGRLGRRQAVKRRPPSTSVDQY